FEGRNTVWAPGAADAAYKETAHRLSDEFAHGGHQSEFIEVQAQQGSHVHYTTPVGRAPAGDELTASLWVKANRPAVQLMARLALPHERAPKRLDQPLTTLLRGDVYTSAGRWQRLELRNPPRLVRQQQQLLRAELRRDVTVADAYVDQLVLNLYAGPGLTRVWTDDLEVGPLLEKARPTIPALPASGGPGRETGPNAGRETGPNVPGGSRPPLSRAAEIRVRQDQLL